MSGQYSHAALSALRGEQDADNLLLKLRLGMAQPDALREALSKVQATGEEPRIRSFCRVISKALEQQVRVDAA